MKDSIKEKLVDAYEKAEGFCEKIEDKVEETCDKIEDKVEDICEKLEDKVEQTFAEKK